MASPLAVTRAFSGEGRATSAETPKPRLAPRPTGDASLSPRLTANPADRTALGLGALMLSTLLFPLSDMLSKTLAETQSGLQVAWMRYVVLLIAIAPALVRRPGLLRTARPFTQLARGLTSATATALALVGFMFLPVADATAIGFCAPLIVTGLAALILKERVGWARWMTAAVGFVGILIIVQPSPGAFRAATLLPLCSSLFSACTVIATRVGRSERVETTVAYSAIVGFVAMSIAVIPVWTPLDAYTLGLAAVMGALAAAASILQVVAYRCAPASLLAPFSYAQILWATGTGWLAFGTVPGAAMLLGSTVVIGSGCAAALQARGPRRRWSRVRSELARIDPAQRARAA
ncbi:DMT family transporter [Lichenihabitans sp. Uapishka_5]|uniref:DMT family transporter n=1 Tax=Lichenihabitans sp. Uapishka_5 TaxID=3037302 RepID=UPI0029E7DC80|nr:DMT family transporter [Lichenihabitans sp. Uapishka_5]MDX7950648.1 DMT family transporter [Lichenihabitans sp. Uapishka_5]